MTVQDDRFRLYYHPQVDDAPRLVKALKGELAARKQWQTWWPSMNGTVRDTVYAFERIGSAALPTLLASVRDRNPFVCLAAAEAITRIDSQSLVGLNALCEMLGHSKEVIREGAASAFRELTARCQRVLPKLCKLARHGTGSTREHALIAIGGIGVKTATTESVLKKALKDADSAVRDAAESAAVALKLKTPELIRLLIGDLNLKDPDLSALAIDHLAELGPVPNVPIEPLRRAFENANCAYRNRVIRAVWLCAIPALAALPLLKMGMADPDYNVRETTVFALGNVKPKSQDVVDLMLKASQDDHPAVRSVAACGLVEVAPRRQVVPILGKMLQDQDGAVRAFAIEAVTKLGRVTPQLEDSILRAANDREALVRINVVLAITRLKIGQPRVVRLLIKLLRDQESEVRGHAAVALGELGRKAKPAIAALKRIMRDEEPLNHPVAYDALAKIDPASMRGVMRPEAADDR
jgi:HEAT repeat protein